MTKRREVLGLGIAAAVAPAVVVGVAQAAEGRYGKQKVVYHVNYTGGDGGKAYMAALGNVKNHIEAVGRDNIEVKIVLHGDGVGLLKDAASDLRLQGAVSNVKNQGVAFAVCNNTLVGRKIDPDSLFEVFKEDIVPSGVAEVAYLQSQGYSYLKP